MSGRGHRSLLMAALLLPLMLLPFWLPSVAAHGLQDRGSAAPETELTKAFERARSERTVHLTADVDMRLVPRAGGATAPSRTEHSTMLVEGDVVRPGRWTADRTPSSRLLLLAHGDETSVDLIVAEGRAYIGYQGSWAEAENPLGATAPSGDYLGYLAAAVDVKEVGTRDTAAGPLTRYTFRIDGPLYAEIAARHAEEALRGRLPDGVRLAPQATFMDMAGRGELFVDADGLPRREIIELSMPGTSEAHDSHARIVVDFSHYGEPLPRIAVPAPGPDGSLHLPTADAGPAGAWAPLGALPGLGSVPGVPDLPYAQIVLIALAVAVCVAIVRHREHRTLYTAVVVAVILAMIGGPLLRQVRVNSFRASVAAAAPLEQALGEVGLSTGTPLGEEVLESQLARVLSDAEGGVPRDCRNLYPDKDGTADEDGDGLSNETEWCLGTAYDNHDTDFDTITDTLELQGFDFGGSHWLLDPLSSDTDLDGISDGAEWYPDTSGEDVDFDGDGLPNVWDEDNDDDGVLDGEDISPYKVLPYSPSFEVQVAGHYAGTIVYVDVQIQPEERKHLRYSTTQFDWPDDDQAQVKDLDSSAMDVRLIPVLEITSPISPTLGERYGVVSHADDDGTYQLWAPLSLVGSGGSAAAFQAHLAFTSDEADQGLDLTDGRLVWLTQVDLDSYKAGSTSEVQTEQSVVSSYYEGMIRITGLNVMQSKDAQVALFGTSAPATTTDPDVADEYTVMMNLISGFAPSFIAHVNPALPALKQSLDDPSASPPYTDTWGVDPGVIISRLDHYSDRDSALATTGVTTTKEFLEDNYSACAEDTQAVLSPTLAVAYQETSGNLDINSSLVKIVHGPDRSFKPVRIQVPMSSAGVVEMRRVQLSQYGCANTGNTGDDDDEDYSWRAVPLAVALTDVQNRYADMDSKSFVGLAGTMFATYYLGRASIVTANGHPLPDIGETADPADLAMFQQPGATSLPEYVRRAYDLDRLVLSISSVGTLQAFRDWSRGLGIGATWLSYVSSLAGPLSTYIRRVWQLKFFNREAYIDYLIGNSETGRLANFVKEPPGAYYEYGRGYQALTKGEITFNQMRAFGKAGYGGKTVEENLAMLERRLVSDRDMYRLRINQEMRTGMLQRNLRNADNQIAEDEGEAFILERPGATSKWFKASVIIIGVVVMVVTIAVAWIVYGTKAKELSGIAKDSLWAASMATTFLAIIQVIIDILIVVLANTVVGSILLIVVMIITYIVVAAIAGDWNPMHTYDWLTKWLAKGLLKVDYLAEVPDDGGVRSSPPHMVVTGGAPDADGAIVSTTFGIDMVLTTTIQANTDVKHTGAGYIHGRQGNDDDVKQSWAFAQMNEDPDGPPFWATGFSVSDSVVADSADASVSGDCDSEVSDSSKGCYNRVSIGFTAASSGRNLPIPLLNQLSANLRYQKCKVGLCSTDTNFSKGPEKPGDDATQDKKDAYDDAKLSIYIDVLPETLDKLFEWGAPDESGTVYDNWNFDHDADIVTNAKEAVLGTDPHDWDTDDDGLSDGVEVTAVEPYQTDALIADTDGDGLMDGQEMSLGTEPNNDDTDDDGLTDGEEVCRLSDGDSPSMVGGWAVTQVGSSYWTCSDPLKADADNDLLNDAHERAAGTSPYAPNTAPGLSLSSSPSGRHGNRDQTVLKPGETYSVTLRLDDTTSEPIDRPMTLTYAVGDLGTMAAIEQTAAPPDYEPPTPDPVSGGLEWDLAADPLYATESMTSTLGGSVPLSVTESRRTTLLATLAYTDPISQVVAVLTTTRPVLIDLDDPVSAVTAPSDGDRVNGESQIVAGTASDPTSWPVLVDVRATGTEYVGGSGQAYDTGWQAADGTETWSWTWTLPGDGVFTLRSRATDYLGYVETPGAGNEVVVDNTAPGANFTSLDDGDVLMDIDKNTVTLEGNATDLLSGAPEVAGLWAVQLSVDGRPWRNVAEYFGEPHPQEADWEYDWHLSGATYGDHVLAVRAVDALGQRGEPAEITVTVDTLEPGDILSNARPDVSASGPVSFLGHVDDEANVPPPARPVSLETGPVRASEVISGATVWLMPDGPTTSTLSATWLGDVDGDRRADLAVGTPHKAIGEAENAGRVSIVYGRAGGWPVPPDALAIGDSGSSFVGGAGALLGEHIAAAGDVSGDGLSDLLIGDPFSNAAYVVFGRVGPLGKDTDVTLLHGAAYGTVAKVFTVSTGDVGRYVSSAGDVNGDGYDDLLIGVTGLSENKSRVYLVLGSDPATGALGQGQQFVLDRSDATAPKVVGAVFEVDGRIALATGVGDVNGDQFGDIAVVAPNEAVYVILGGEGYVGQVGPAPVDPADAAAGSVTGGLPDGKHLVALGDVTGDGLPDLAYSSGNEPQVVYGRMTGWTKSMTADAGFDGYSPAPNGFMAGVGDVNDDGLSDLLMGTLSGRAYLVHGRADLATSQPVAAVLSNAADAASAPYAAGADGNCDDSSDLLVVPMTWLQHDALEEEDPTDYSASPPDGFAQRTLRPELSLGPPAAPRRLSELPMVNHGGDRAAGATAGRVAGTVVGPADEAPLRLTAAPAVRYVDDDYCATCANDGHAWGTDAFATIQDGLDAAQAGDSSSRGDTVLVGPGVYVENAVFHAGKDYVTLRGVDPDAVFLDAGGGTGIEVFPPSEHGPDVSGIEGVWIERLTIRNASPSVEVNYGGTPGVEDIADPGNIRIRNVIIVQTTADSSGVAIGNAVNRSSSNVEVRHNTLVANGSSVKLVHNVPAALSSNIFLRDNLFVALPNASPKPAWFADDNGDMGPVKVNDDNGFASQTGAAGEWATAPTGNDVTLMTLTAAEFQDVSSDVYRIGGGSAAHAEAGDGGDLGYYTYHGPVWVDPTYCAKCDNDGRTWGSDAFASVQAAIDSGAWKVSLDPGVYRERVHLVNGVSIYGSGAGLTALAPPDETDGALIGAEGVRAAQVALLTLAGDGHDDGLRLDAGAHVTLKRSIVRDSATAVAVDGSAGGATATLLNDTIVSNAAGVAATSCGNVDVSNTILAYNTGTALTYEQCATTKLHTYDLYWRNGRDIDDGASDTPTPGEVYADPRLTDASHNDYRPLPDSPVVDAGDPRSPHPPGTGKHVDIGYVQSVDAAVYVSGDYCQTCLNDGLEWQVDAFGKVQDGVDHVPDAPGVWTVGVAPGLYVENVALKSGVRLVGSGADLTMIDGGGTETLTVDGATHVEVRGFTLQSGGLEVTGASNKVTVTHNVVVGAGGASGAAVRFDGGSTGAVAFNTIVNNVSTGLELAGLGTWVQARFNIFAGNDVGIDDSSQGHVFDGYNLMWQNETDAAGSVDLAATTVYGDPNFVDPAGVYSLMLPSAAAEAIPLSGYQPVPLGGGDRADIGYQELLAVPVSLMMGKEGERNCGMGASGVDTLVAAVVKVDDATKSAAETAPPSPAKSPGSWTTVTISDTSKIPGTNKNAPASYWAWTSTLADGDGLYRLYTVPTDVSGNASTEPGEWYRSRFIADSAAPTVTLVEPSGTTTTAPAVQLGANVSDVVDTGGVMRDNVARVYFEVDGAVFTATKRAVPTGTYHSAAALVDGTHVIRAVAVDRAGNVGRSTAKSLTVTTPRNEAALVIPAPGSAVTQTTVSLMGYVHYTSTEGDGQVHVSVDGGTAVAATIEEPKAQATRWTAQVTLTGEGSHTLTMTAQRSTDPGGAHDSTAQLTLDTVAPAVTVQPQPGTAKLDVTFTGTATDATSGVATVEVSTDGGHSWAAADHASGTWTFDWTVPLETDYARFPLRVRATDAAGNTAVKADTFVADNLGPTPFEMTTLDPAEGSHEVAPAQVQLAWTPPEDGSGTVTMIAAADQMTDTIPTGAPLPANEFVAQLTEAGTWYVHVLAEDGEGNQTLRHYGPWHAEATGTPIALGWRSSIRVDGRMHVQGKEWGADNELMDSDPRPGRPQELWVAFDEANLYVGWRGASWGVDGTGYVYLDAGTGGTTVPMAGTGATVLPFEADALIETQAGGGTLYAPVGGEWQQISDAGVVSAYGAHGETEARVPWSALGRAAGDGALGMLAHSSVHGAVKSVFPTDNAAASSWLSAYLWSAIDPSTVPNVGQSTGHHTQLALTSLESAAAPVGPNSTVRYVVDIENLDHAVLPGVTLVLTATEGLTLVDMDGGGGPEPGPQWRIDLGGLTPGPAAQLLVTAQVAEDVTAATVGVAAQLVAGTPAAEAELARGSLSHLVDTDGPTVRLRLPQSGATLKSGTREIRGSSTDRDGIGVAYVEVKVGDGAWARAVGTSGWSSEVEMPASGEIELSARAFDGFGNEGEAVALTVSVDNTAPAASLDSMPDVVTSRLPTVSGTARDSQPDGGPIARVEVQLDDGRWMPATGYIAHGADGTATWRTQLPLPIQEGIPHEVRARAVDQAGNVGAPTESQQIIIDNRGPTSAVDEPKAGATVTGDGTLLIWGHAHDGWGVETVDVSADGGRTWHDALLRAEAARLIGSEYPYTAPADSPGPTAIYLPTVSKGAAINPGTLWAIELSVPPGKLALRSRAEDRGGNVESLGVPVRIQYAAAE